MKQKTMQYKAAGFAMLSGGRAKGMVASDGRSIHGILSPFGPPPDNANPPDIIEEGAYTDSLKERPNVVWLWQHDHKAPVGKTVILEEIPGLGLYFKTRLTPGVQQADETLALVKDEVIVGTSIGFNPVESVSDVWEGERIRRLKKIDLFEGSSVTFAAAQRARALPFADVDQLADTLTICEFKAMERRGWLISPRQRLKVLKAMKRQLERDDKELEFRRLFGLQEAYKQLASFK